MPSFRCSCSLLLPLCAAFAANADTKPGTDEARPWFTEEAAASGIAFTHFNGMSGDKYMAETMGSGVALFDYDGDGDLDLYLVQGRMLGADKGPEDALFPLQGNAGDRLYRNDLELTADGSRQLRFSDVTVASGMRADDYGMGVAVGDYDGDGDLDLYVTNYGPNRLWRNEGDGRFTDVTVRAGVGGGRWSVSAAFLDYDRDGLLDLFVGDYVDFQVAKHQPCYSATGTQDYCSPLVYPPFPSRLYRNLGDGRFADVSGQAGLAKGEIGGSLGVLSADFNGDGWPDVYVANDGRPNQLWLNRKDGSFVDDAFLGGAAVNMDGAAEASMGVDAADFDGDGDEDLFMTHILEETNTLYVNDGQGWFEDRTVASGLARFSQGFTAFGTAWVDYDNDGWLDLFIANGDVRALPERERAGDRYPLDQPNQLLRNLGDGRFDDVSGEAGPVFALEAVGRGVATGDIDNDGDSDWVVANNNGPVHLYINQIGHRRHWLGLNLVGENGAALPGARVELLRDDGSSLWRRARADGSYASANDARVLIGRGDEGAPARLKVHWPDGRIEAWSGLASDRYHRLQRGGGDAVEAVQ